MNMRRRIFSALRDHGGPMTTEELAVATGGRVATIANECYRMEAIGVLDRPNGARKGYRLLVEMLPEDAAALASLVDIYGRPTVRKAMTV